jgi:hypothetical protein
MIAAAIGGRLKAMPTADRRPVEDKLVRNGQAHVAAVVRDLPDMAKQPVKELG